MFNSKFLSLIFIAWSSLVFAQVPMTGAGKGTPGSSAVTFAITFGSEQENTTAGLSFSIPSVGFSSADPNRYAVVAICIRSANAISTPTVTIGGAATTKVIDQSVGGAPATYSGLFETNAVFPTGTTATVAVSSFGVGVALRAAAEGYSVVTSTSTPPSGSATVALTPSSPAMTGSITQPSNGRAIIAMCVGANNTPSTMSAPASGVTAFDYDAVISGTSTETFSAHDTVSRVSGPTTYTITTSGATNTGAVAGAAAAWAP